MKYLKECDGEKMADKFIGKVLDTISEERKGSYTLLDEVSVGWRHDRRLYLTVLGLIAIHKQQLDGNKWQVMIEV